MIPHLIRRDFPDLVWDAADLDAVAEFWLRLYEEAARSRGFGRTPDHDTEIRLRGFPRHAGEDVLRELAEHADLGDFPEGEIDRPDPDTLMISTGALRGEERPPVGLGLPILASGTFDGLMVEIRFRAVGDEAKIIRKGKVESTLVIVGELRAEALLVKGLWRVGSHGWEDKLAWFAVWPDQEKWLAAFEQFRDTNAIPRALAKKLFVNHGADNSAGFIVKCIHVPLEKPRLGGLLIRATGFAIAATAMAFLITWAFDRDEWLLFAAGVFASSPLALLVFLFIRNEWRLWFLSYRLRRTEYAALYSEPVRHIPMSRSEGDARGDHPYLHKFTDDLEAAGFRYAGDLRLEPELFGEGMYRTFYSPDNISYLTVAFNVASCKTQNPRYFAWPAVVVFMAYTFFADGSIASSVSGHTVGYRKKRTGDEHSVRVVPNADEPVEFARLHSAAAERFGAANGRRPQPHQSFEQYVCRQKAIFDEERSLFVENPYTWADHLGWYLQRPRKEYRG